jgi:vancomycin resistance protein YoaR
MKKRMLALTVILAVLSIGTTSVSYVYATGSNWNDVIYPRVYIEEINVGGKPLVEVEELIRKEYDETLISKKIEIVANGKSYNLDYGMIGATYNTDEVIKEAFSYGKQGNIIEKYKLIKGEEDKKFNLEFSYNSKIIDEFIDKIEQDVNRTAENAKIAITKGDIKITNEVTGVKLEKDKLKQDILDVINGEVSKEYIKIQAPIEVVKPQITNEKLSAVNSLIASFSTSFPSSSANRINNIELSTKAINGTLLMPGESFSFNETVGERTKARGYKEAGVIIGDNIESGLGGGICQVSSTLYSAILKTSIKVDERRNHSLPLAYIGKGLDATVDWGNIDFKFTNTLEIPVYIEGYTKDKNVYFNVYSDKVLTAKSYEMNTEVSVVQPTIKYINDATMLKGETKVVKSPSNGYRVKVYRKTLENGKVINNEAISNDYYRARNGEIVRGTKGV